MKLFKINRKYSKGLVIAGKFIFTLELVNPFFERKYGGSRAVEGIDLFLSCLQETLIMLLGFLAGIFNTVYSLLAMFGKFIPIQIELTKRDITMEEIEKRIENMNKKA